MVASSVVVLTPDHPPLPLELLDEVFRITASSSTQSCLALCLVSSWVYRLVIPYLMDQVVITSFPKATSLRDHLFASLPRVRNFADPVLLIRGLWLPDHISLPPRIFLASKNLRRAAIHIQALCNLASECPLDLDSNRELDHDLDLTLLGGGKCNYEHLTKARFLMSRVTRLHLVSNAPVLLFHNLPHVTHLASTWTFSFHDAVELFTTTLPALKVLVFVIDTRFTPSIQKIAKEFIYMLRNKEQWVWFLEADRSELRAEWEDEARGGESLWDRAIRQTTNWEKVNYCALCHRFSFADHSYATWK